MENNTYKLTISALNTENGTSSIELTYNGQPGTTPSVEIKKGTQSFVNCKISAFSYAKEIYRPGKIRFTLLLTWSGGTPTVDTVYKVFQSSVVQLQTTVDGTSFVIAEQYFVFQVQLEQRSGASTSMYAHIEAYSPEQYLTLDSYCKAYTGRKFIADIVTNSSLWPDAIPLFSDQTKFSKLCLASPQFLTYEVTRKNPQTQQDEKKTYEYIQPYLVQYNESFYDFLVRVANRCGEFLYYENGKLHIGWEKPSSTVYLTHFTSIQYMQSLTTAWTSGSLTEVHNDYTTNTNRFTVQNAKMRRDSEVAFDENLTPIPPKDQYTSWQDYAAWPEAFWIDALTTALNETSLTDIIAKLVWQTSTTRYDSENSAKSANDDYKETHFTGAYLQERVYKSSQGNSSSSSPQEENGDAIDDKDGIYLYSSTPRNADQVPFGLAFYADIQRGIAQAERSRIRVVLENRFYAISLGSLITFDAAASQCYIVVKMDHTVTSQTQQTAQTSTAFSGTSASMAPPTGLVADETPSEMLVIEAIPYDAKAAKVYPPSAQVGMIRVAKAQRAIVTHNDDPLKMGRVRVRYPWQQESDDSTPWIRMVQPMASKESGFRFLPEEGDEAIINYENGNIERPYVEGMLFSAERSPSYGHKGSSSRIFSSRNGHSIIFSDPKGDSFFKSFFPVLGTLSTFIPQLKVPMGSSDFKKASGGIQLTDEYGFYSISMSSDKRAISIDSPLGKVSLNAFTGITISAPNGDIKIAGKNIDIVAGNNLTLRSGKNKGGVLPTSLQRTVGDVAGFVVGKFALVDLSVIRTVFETFVRPIAGTLRLSSKRYLCLEAGKGSAQIMGRRTVQKFTDWKSNPIGKSAFESYTIDRNPANKVFTSNIPHELETLLDGIRQLFKEHRIKSAEMLDRFERYQQVQQLLEAIDLASFVKDTHIETPQKIFQDAKSHHGPKVLEMQSQIVGKDPALIRRVRTRVGRLNRLAVSIYENWYDEEARFDRQFEAQPVAHDSMVRQQIHALMEPVLPSTWVSKQDGAEAVRGIQIQEEKFRQVMFLGLKWLVSNQKTEEGQNYTDSITMQGVGSPKDYDRQHWIAFVDQISATSVVADILKTLAKGLVKADSFDGMLDQYVWDRTDYGKILLSDEKGKTLHIDQGTLQTYMESRNQVDDVDHTIDEIKRILHRLD